MRLRLRLFAETWRSLSLLGLSEEGREGGRRKGGGKNKTKRKKAAPTAAVKMNGSTFSFIHSEGLVQGCAQTLLRSLFSFFFSSYQVAKDVWVAIVLIRSKMTEALSWEIAVNWRLPKHPSWTVSVLATLFLSSSVTFGLALFSSTLALATLVFFTSPFPFFFSLFWFSFPSV